MSELKEIGIRWEEDGELHFSHVYLKSEADKVIAHQKYKRCLAMAKWCEAELFTYPPFGTESPKEKWCQKWHKRWLELAEKFKEAK